MNSPILEPISVVGLGCSLGARGFDGHRGLVDMGWGWGALQKWSESNHHTQKSSTHKPDWGKFPSDLPTQGAQVENPRGHTRIMEPDELKRNTEVAWLEVVDPSKLYICCPHFPSGLAKKSSNFLFTTKMVFPKSLKFMNSGSLVENKGNPKKAKKKNKKGNEFWGRKKANFHEGPPLFWLHVCLFGRVRGAHVSFTKSWGVWGSIKPSLIMIAMGSLSKGRRSKPA